MADKNNVSSFFFNDKSNPEDFYLNNDTPSNRKTADLDTKKASTVHNKPIFSAVASSPVTHPVAAARFSWNNQGVSEPVKAHPTFSSEANFVDKGDVLSNRDHSISDEEAIDEILKTEVVDFDSNQGRRDYFADLDAKSTADFKEHDQNFNANEHFAKNANEQKPEDNLAELDVLKQKLHDASESFSQISNSIEILSGDIDNVNKDFSDYLNSFDQAEEENKSSAAKPIEVEEAEPSVTKSIEELARIIGPDNPVDQPMVSKVATPNPTVANFSQPEEIANKVDEPKQPTVVPEVEQVKQAPTPSSVVHVAEPIKPPVSEPITPVEQPNFTPIHEKPIDVQPTQVVEEVSQVSPPVQPVAPEPVQPPVASVVEPPVVSPLTVEPVAPEPVEPVPPKPVTRVVQPAEVITESDTKEEVTPTPMDTKEHFNEPTTPLSEAEAALQAKLAELEPEISSFDEMIEAEEIQKEVPVAPPVAEEKATEVEEAVEEPVAPKPKLEELPDYSAILADLKQQAVMQVQNAVQSELERLISAKAKLEAELEALTRNRNFENNITDLKERFSSIVSHRQETTPVTPAPAPTPEVVVSQKPPVVEIDETTSPIADINAIEAQRTSIINATKKIMEQYDLPDDEEESDEVPQADEQVVSVAEEKVVENVPPPPASHEAKFDSFVDEVDKIKKEIVNVIKNEVASAIKEEIADIKSGMHHDKVAEAAEQLKTRILVDAANEKKKLDKLIQKTITHEIGLSLLDEDDKSADSLDEMRNSLRHRQVGNEVEEQSRLYDMDRIRHELKDEILNEVRAWNSNLFNSNESKIQQEPPAEQVLGDWFDASDSTPIDRNEGGQITRSPSSRSANLVFDPEIAHLKGRDLILKYVKDLTKKRPRKPK